MATFDDMIVRLFLDVTGLEQGQKEATALVDKSAADLAVAAGKGEKAQTDAHAKTTASAVRMGKAISTSNKALAESFEGAIRTGLTFLAVLAGAKGIEDFTRRITALDAALGRTSHGMGQAPETLSAIGRAAQRMGGSFDGAVGGLRGLSDAFQDLRTTGSNAIMEPLARLQALSGKAITFGKGVHANFLSIADALHAKDAKDPALADRLGRQILGDEGLVNLAKKGGPAVLADEAESRRHGVITPEDAAAAQKLQSAYEGLSNTVTDLGTKIETKLTPYVSDLLIKLTDWIDKNKDVVASQVNEWLQQFIKWLQDHKKDIEDFGKAVGDIAIAAGTLAAAFSKQSPMMMALEAFGLLLTGPVLLGINSVLGAMRLLSAVAAPAWMLRFLGLPGIMLAAGGAAGAMNSGHTDEFGRDAGTWGGDAPDAGPLGAHLRHRKAHTPHSTLRRLWDWGKSKVGLGGENAPAPASTANALGANGHGLTDAPYTRSVDLKGEGGHLSPRELFNYLKSQRATDNEATMLTGAAGSESSFNPEANHDPAYPGGPPTGHGLWGHKHTRIDMRGMNWQQQADAALDEVHRKYAGRVNAAKTPQELADAEMFYEGPRGFTVRNPRGGDNYTGRLHTIDRFSREFGTLGHASGNAVAAPSVPSTSMVPIGDKAALEARQRRQDGKPRTGDEAMLAEYQRQQATPARKPIGEDDRETRARPPVPHAENNYGAGHNAGRPETPAMPGAARMLPAGRLTLGDVATHVAGLMKPIPVDITDKSAGLIGKRSFESMMGIPKGSRPDLHAAWHGLPAKDAQNALDFHRYALRDLARHRAVTNNATNNYDHSSETRIGSIAIHTAATDAKGIAADIEPHLQRGQAAGRADYGLA